MPATASPLKRGVKLIHVSKDRIDWVDHLKAIGIYLMVFGHHETMSNAVVKYIYSHLVGKNPRLQAGEISVLSGCYDSVISLKTQAGLNNGPP